MKCYSEEADSRSCGELKKQKKTAEEEESRRGGGKGGDGSSNEGVKRRRGRPPGSKNKPQLPVVITREFTDSSPAMRPHVLEIPAGRDVAAALAAFSRCRALGLCVLAAAGAVSKVTLRQSSLPVEGSPSAASVVTLGGPFEILSMSGTFFPPYLPAAGAGVFSVSLSGPLGRLVGGIVAGPLVAAGTVMVVAAAFAQPTFHRLPVEEEEAGSASASLSGGGGGGDEVAGHPGQDEDDHDAHDEEAQYHYQHHHYHDHRHHGSCDGTPIYAGHFPPDVLWTPPARSPHPPPPPPPPPPPYRFT